MYPISFLLLPLPLLLVCIEAARVPFTSTQRFSPAQRHSKVLAAAAAASDCANSTCGGLGDLQDLVYISNVTVGGLPFRVQLDTGSSDLWINASQQPVPAANLLNGVFVSDVYGDQSNFTGEVAFADVEFHGYTVANQSINYATISENDNVSPLNVQGLMGLSFNGLSFVQNAVQQATGSATAGQTFLSNVFASNPTLQPFITFFLSREDDLNTTATTGAFTVAEIEQGYDAINDQQQVSLVPQDSTEWTIPVDSFIVAGNSVQLPASLVTSGSSSVVGLLDTGTSNILMPSDLITTVYSQMSGAKVQSGQWVIPCDAEPPTVAFSIGGQTFPIHPLDVNPISNVYKTSSGSLVSVCSGGLSPQKASSRFDILLGAPFLKNSYTMFNYGVTSTGGSTTSSGAFVKLLSVTNPSAASSDFGPTRKAQLALAPAASAQQISQILAGSSAFTPVNIPALPGTSGGNGNSDSGNNGTGSTGGGTGGSGHSAALRLTGQWQSALAAGTATFIFAMLW